MKTSVAIIGAGPAGSSSAMLLRSHGIDCVLIEKDEFPRYHIGESTTGECGASIRALGLEEEMKRRDFPIKRSAAIYGAKGHKWGLPVAGRDKDWNLFPQSTWQVRRAEFDKMLLDTALERGAGFVQGQVKKPIIGDDGAVRGLQVEDRDGKTLEMESELVLDCSGQATCLANMGVTGPKYVGNYDKQIAIFSQVAGTVRDDMLSTGDTLLFYKKKHHWAWFIPLDDDSVSVGTVIPAAYFKDQGESKADFLMRELRELNPELERRVPDNTLIEPVRSNANYSYQVRDFCGKGFICVGDAHRFIDPMFSFGLCIAFAESRRATDAAKAYLNGKGRDDADPFAGYQASCEEGLDAVEDMMDAFWEYPLAFAKVVFNHEGEMIDLFAGRLWERQPNVALTKFRQMLKRDRSDDQNASMPIGSRYHPERAHIWVDQEMGV